MNRNARGVILVRSESPTRGQTYLPIGFKLVAVPLASNVSSFPCLVCIQVCKQSDPFAHSSTIQIMQMSRKNNI